MEQKTVVMNFTGVYKEERFFETKDFHWISFEKMEGVNCYCTQEAEEEIKKRIEDFPAEGIHFLDSGNYHYLSKFWLEKRTEPFDLLVFDNHTDMQQASFFGLLSCGSWVKEVMDTNPYVQQICIVGPSKKAFEELAQEDRERIFSVTKENLDEGIMDSFDDFLCSSPQRPLYMSVDKDLLCREDSRTNWDQGETTLGELCGWFKKVFVGRRILGIDICGENPQETAMPIAGEDMEINSRTNAVLWKFFVEELRQQEKKSEDQEFLQTTRAERKLEISVRRYFELTDTQDKNQLKDRYVQYLTMRLRPAGDYLIRKNENRKLEKLLEEMQVSNEVLDGFIQAAAACGNGEAQILLLKKKQETTGFKKEDWEL